MSLRSTVLLGCIAVAVALVPMVALSAIGLSAAAYVATHSPEV